MMDRRLRAIVEAIRVQNLKQAWKLANGLDQKKPGWKALEVLKAVILDKWGKTEEADRLIQQLDNDWQEETLQALQLFYDQRRDWSSLADVYQQWWTQNKTTTSLGETCILYYIRAKKYSEAQKVANKLYRSYPSQKHYMAWWILCLILQVRYEQQVDTRILTLAAKLAHKYISESNRVSAVPACFIRLYILLLEHLNEYEQAKQCLRLCVSTSFHNDVLKKDYMEWLADICYREGQQQQPYEEAAHLYEQLIVEHQMENYNYWHKWMKCQLKKDTENNMIDDEDALRHFVQWLLEQTNELYCRALFHGSCSTQDTRSLQRRKRTLYMTQMELCQQVATTMCGENSCRIQDWISQQLYAIMQQYLHEMSSLPCCSTDLKVFLPHLKPKERNQLCEDYLLPCTKTLSKESIGTVVEYLWLLLSLDVSSLPRMQTLLDCYVDWAQKDVKPFEHQHADGLILLIVQQLLLSNDDTSSCSPSRLLQAIQVLEIGKQHSPYNLEFSLFLVVFYSYLGCFENAVEEWNALDLKHIQLLTLSFLLGPSLHRWYDVPWMRWYHKGLSSLEREHREETPQGIFLAIRQQSYETALEIVQFQYKVDHSEALFASTIYAYHESLFYAHRNGIRTSRGFSSDWLRQARIAYRSLIQQWNEQSCLVEDLYILDDHSVWKKGLGMMNPEHWLGRDEKRIDRLRLDYINLRLFLSLLEEDKGTTSVSRTWQLPSWTAVFFDAIQEKNNRKEDDEEEEEEMIWIEYWYLFWQLMNTLVVYDSSTSSPSMLSFLYEQFYAQWQRCISSLFGGWQEQTSIEYFPIQFPRCMYYVHHIELYGILSIGYLVDRTRTTTPHSSSHGDKKNENDCPIYTSILKQLIALFRPVDRQTTSMLDDKQWHHIFTLWLEEQEQLLSTSSNHQQYRRLLVKTYLQKIHQLQQDIQYLSKLYKTILPT